jgi:hypothetical protein
VSLPYVNRITCGREQAILLKIAVLLPPDFLYPGILGLPVEPDEGENAFRPSKYPFQASQHAFTAFCMTWTWKDR